MYTIELDCAAPPLRPGESGMKTNGPVGWWWRINNGEWMPCGRANRSGYLIKEKLLRILEGGSDVR